MHRLLPQLSSALVLCTLLVTATACPDEGLNYIAPQIAVDVCSSPELERGGERIGGVRDCTVTFDAQAATTRVRRELTITNASPVKLLIHGATFTADSDPAFAVESMPDTVAEGQTVIAVVSYRPLVAGEQHATLVLSSDAENVAEGEDVVITLRGSAYADGAPDLVVSPAECDYGRVAADGVAVCNVTVENVGQRDLVFDGALLETASDTTADAFSFAGRAPARGDALAAVSNTAGAPSTTTIGVRFRPTALGDYAGSLQLLTNDPDTPSFVVPLRGTGVTPPSCAITVSSVNGIDSDGSATIEPLDDIVLSAAGSTPSRSDGAIAAVHWRILESPGGSTATLMQPSPLEAAFTFAGGVRGLDLAGRYVVAAAVVDELGTESVNECVIAFEAIPTESILAQLSWDTAFGDMDLHVIKADEGGRFCGEQTAVDGLVEDCPAAAVAPCYYGSCRPGGDRPDWDGDGNGQSAGDPSLDIDDLCGFGPENINIDLAAAGTYLVGVHFYGFTGCSGNGIVGNTARIYLYGQLHAEMFQDLENDEFWEVAVIHWPGPGGGEACVEDLATAELECAGF